jgi:hypothetical protein
VRPQNTHTRLNDTLPYHAFLLVFLCADGKTSLEWKKRVLMREWDVILMCLGSLRLYLADILSSKFFMELCEASSGFFMIFLQGFILCIHVRDSRIGKYLRFTLRCFSAQDTGNFVGFMIFLRMFASKASTIWRF